MIIEEVQRVANPTRKRKRRVKLSKAQIAAGFGGKRRKKNAHRSRTKIRARAANPVRRKRRAHNPRKRAVKTRTKVVYVKAAPKRRRRRASNPKRRTARRKARKNPSIMTLGYLNPERTKRVRKARRKKATQHHHRAKASNPRRRRRAVYAKNPRRRSVRRHHNPSFLGSGMEALGVLGGVAAQKLLKGFIPTSLTSGNALLTAGASFAVAFIVGKGADMLMKGKPIGKGIALGALASATSDAINAFVPSLGSTIGLSGFGVYQDALFAVPENPIMRALPTPSVPVASKPGVGMLNAAFGNSF